MDGLAHLQPDGLPGAVALVHDPEREAATWADAMLAVACVAVDPRALGGVAVRAHAGPVRDRLMSLLRGLAGDLMPIRRLPPHCADDRLLGGLDMTATLAAGRPVVQRGLLAEADGGLVVLPMAERADSLVVSRLTAALDRGEVALERDGLTARLEARIGIVALDEGIEAEEAVAHALADRLAFRVDLSALSVRSLVPCPLDADDIMKARALFAARTAEIAPYEAMAALAAAFGVSSARIVLLAVRVAQAIAALDARTSVEDSDIEAAARLVIAPRATRLPSPQDDVDEDDLPEPASEQDEAPDPRDDEGQADTDDPPPPPDGPLEDQVLDAVEAAIPADLLAKLKLGASLASGAQTSSGGQGGERAALQRGRPLGARRGRLDGRHRLHLIETLRAAAPWQTLRKRDSTQAQRVHVRGEDIRVRRYKQRDESLTVFIVDASGSSALHRLAEVKGAVELLLAESYARRDMVALVAFRGQGAELVLPPTRSLVRAKRALTALPGGGGTPLAAGIDAGVGVALDARRQGRSPRLVLMTDGSANIGHDPAAGRNGARADAEAAARRLAGFGLACLFIDTSPRRNPRAAELAAAMGAVYLPLPHPNAQGIRTVVATAQAQDRLGRKGG